MFEKVLKMPLIITSNTQRLVMELINLLVLVIQKFQLDFKNTQN